MKWFGIDIVRPEEQRTETPVGARCGFCVEEIEADDRGCTIPDMSGGEGAYHFECYIRVIVGSLAHQQKRCSCYGHDCTELDPPNMTLREAARVALVYWVAHRGGGQGDPS